MRLPIYQVGASRDNLQPIKVNAVSLPLNSVLETHQGSIITPASALAVARGVIAEEGRLAGARKTRLRPSLRA